VKLSSRCVLDEVMDTPSISFEDYTRCLHDLAAVNRLTLTHRPTIRWLDRVTKDLPKGSSIAVLDVACGGGDLLRDIAAWGKRRGLNISLEGIDLNPRAISVASQHTPAGVLINYRNCDVFTYQPQPRPDIIVSSQFAHHLADDDLVKFIQWLDAKALRGWFIADLHRHTIPYYGFRLLALIARWHPIVRRDGTASIARSFCRTDWQNVLAAAGSPGEITWHPAFRYCVTRLL